MNTEVFESFKENVHLAIGYINLLDMYFKIAREKIEDYKTQSQGKGANEPIIIPGVEPHFRQDKEDDLLGIIPQTLTDIEKNISPVMINSCTNAIISLITFTEIYLRDIIEWIFRKKPETFCSNKEIKLTHEDIIKRKIDYEYLKNKILERVIHEITKENIANSIEELFNKRFEWDLTKFSTELIALKDISAIRNIIVHNNSKVNKTFLEIISTPDAYNLNDVLIVSPHEFKNNAKMTFKFIKKLDEFAHLKCM